MKHEDVDDRKAEAIQPPSGGCVLKHEPIYDIRGKHNTSRLQAAVC